MSEVTTTLVETETWPVSVGEQGPRGPQGLTGPAGGAAVTRLAVGSVNALRVVAATSATQVTYAQPTTGATLPMGVSTTAGADGEEVNVQLSGELVDAGWGWDVDVPIFLGANGALTQTAPATGVLVVVGRPLTATSMFIAIESPLWLGD